MSVNMTSDVPFACDPFALQPAARARHAEVTAWLLAAAHGIEELPDGYALGLPAADDALLHAAEFITRERLCCPFITFSLHVSQDAARLSLTGAGGVKQLIQAEILAQEGGASHA
jgi:hypothetical protein